MPKNKVFGQAGGGEDTGVSLPKVSPRSKEPVTNRGLPNGRKENEYED